MVCCERVVIEHLRFTRWSDARRCKKSAQRISPLLRFKYMFGVCLISDDCRCRIALRFFLRCIPLRVPKQAFSRYCQSIRAVVFTKASAQPSPEQKVFNLQIASTSSWSACPGFLLIIDTQYLKQVKTSSC